MPKYWGKQIFTHWRFPEVGEKQKTERKERERRAKVGNNNGQYIRLNQNCTAFKIGELPKYFQLVFKDLAWMNIFIKTLKRYFSYIVIIAFLLFPSIDIYSK